MPRSPRIQYPGAIYHIINRGNYRQDVFGEPGSAYAFVETMKEAVDRYGWRLGAFVVMRNHFHLAVQTPEPNLVTGMHWLQSTFATRFNRLHKEQGHVFQGRYRAILLENAFVWARVNDYIHLNPVRAGLIPVEHVAQFRWSSLSHFLKNQKFNGLTALGWLQTLGLKDDQQGWSDYCEHLREKVGDDADSERALLTSGWAIGESDWKKHTLAEQAADSAGSIGSKKAALTPEMLETSWAIRLEAELKAVGKTLTDLESARKGADWKVDIAQRLQGQYGVSVKWLAQELKMGVPGSVRAYLWKRRKNSQVTA